MGSIHHDAPDHEVKDVFREIGDVVDFRMVMDKHTGKRKGYAFCEYSDEMAARRAVQTLDGYEINGRSLRVDFSSNFSDSNPEVAAASSGGDSSRRQRDIASALESLSYAEIHSILDEFRALIERDRAAARKLLVDKPILCQALLQAQLMMGMSTNVPKKSGTSPSASASSGDAPSSTDAKVAQLFSLTDEDIAAMPPEQQAQINQLKRQLGGSA